jgi:hypothetical protein
MVREGLLRSYNAEELDRQVTFTNPPNDFSHAGDVTQNKPRRLDELRYHLMTKSLVLSSTILPVPVGPRVIQI